MNRTRENLQDFLIDSIGSGKTFPVLVAEAGKKNHDLEAIVWLVWTFSKDSKRAARKCIEQAEKVASEHAKKMRWFTYGKEVFEMEKTLDGLKELARDWASRIADMLSNDEMSIVVWFRQGQNVFRGEIPWNALVKLDCGSDDKARDNIGCTRISADERRILVEGADTVLVRKNFGTFTA